MRIPQRMPIRMACADVTVAIRRSGLRQPRRITDRAESCWYCAHVVADGLQPLQDGLPLFPVQLPQKRPQSNSGAIHYRNTKTPSLMRAFFYSQDFTIP